MKRFTLAIALTCILSVSALAGEMPTCGAVSTTTTPTAMAPGEMPTAGATGSAAGETQLPGLLETAILAIIIWF